MGECIFCKIIAGEIPSYKIYEDEKYLAFLDVFPKTSYQMLVIPKQHIEWVWDVPNVGEYYEVAAKIARHIREVAGIPVRQMVYGFQVSHAHIQLRPGERNDRDGSQVSPELLEEWKKKFTLLFRLTYIGDTFEVPFVPQRGSYEVSDHTQTKR